MHASEDKKTPGMVSIRLLRARYRLKKRIEKLLGREAGIDMSTLIEFYRGVWAESARNLDAEFSELSRGVWRVTKDGVATYIDNYIVQIDDPVLLSIAGDKALCYRMLHGAGLPVPEHETYTLETLGRARAFIEARPGSRFVVKPLRGTSGGRGISTHLACWDETVRASVLASLYGDGLIIELLAVGESYRLLVLNGELIHASRRSGMKVRGDGKASIRALYERAAPRQGPRGGLDSDRDAAATLGAQGLTPDSVPCPGAVVLVKSVPVPPADKRLAEVRTVYDEDVTSVISAPLKEQAVLAASAIDSRFCGVDIVTPDPGAGLNEAGGVIIELNTTPGLHHHYNLRTNGAGARTADKVLEYLLTNRSSNTHP